jgi:DNA-binding Xre family transcriptional regulator
MNYNELKEIADAKKIEIKELASALEMTPNGFRESIKNETIQLRKLRTLCDLLRINPSMFFDLPRGVYVNNVHAQVGDNNQMAIDNRDREIESLREQLEDKKVIIKMLQNQIEGASNLSIAASPRHPYKNKGE